MRISLVILSLAIAAVLWADAQPVAGQAPARVNVAMTSAGSMPKVVKSTQLAYPADAPLGGVVEVETVVGPDGVTAHTRLVPSALMADALGRACVEAIRATEFDPPKDELGRPRATFFLARFEFSPPRGNAPAGVTLRLAEVPQTVAPAWASLGDLVVHDGKVSGLTYMRPVREINPRYTPNAMRAKVVGPVDLEIVVLADGTVGAARVTRKLHPELDQSALIAARYWLFEPARLNGQAVAAKATLTLSFALH